MYVSIGQRSETGHWWLQLDDNAIGYWPGSSFTALADSSDAIDCGGEIINNKNGGFPYTNWYGKWAFSKWRFWIGRASYVSNIKYVDENGALRDPEQLVPCATRPSCYNLDVGEDKDGNFGTYFYFGGPGFSNGCQSWQGKSCKGLFNHINVYFQFSSSSMLFIYI